jgi:hypothetical protein
MQRWYRARSRFISDHRPYSTPTDGNERARLYVRALILERETKQPGKRNGVLGLVSVLVLHAFLFTFMNRKTGLCCPSIAALVNHTGLAKSTIQEALKRLEAAGILRRVRRVVRTMIDVNGMARLTTVQTSSLYSFAEPSPTAHGLPTISDGAARHARADRRQTIAGRLESLLAGVVKGFEPIPAGGKLTRYEV